MLGPFGFDEKLFAAEFAHGFKQPGDHFAADAVPAVAAESGNQVQFVSGIAVLDFAETGITNGFAVVFGLVVVFGFVVFLGFAVAVAFAVAVGFAVAAAVGFGVTVGFGVSTTCGIWLPEESVR